MGRIILGFGLLLTTFEGAVALAVLHSDVILVPVVGDWYTANDLSFSVWLTVMAIACLGTITGVLVRSSLLVIAIGDIALLLSDEQAWSNHRYLAVLVTLCFVPAGSDRAFAPRASARRARCATVPWWPQLLALSAVSSCYLFAGLSKINPAFLNGAVLSDLNWITVPSALMAPLASVIILTEVGIGIGLWLRRARYIAVAVGLGFHVSIILLVDGAFVLTAFALICLGVYPLALARPQLKVGRGHNLAEAGTP